jgi:hypothetical protein
MINSMIHKLPITANDESSSPGADEPPSVLLLRRDKLPDPPAADDQIDAHLEKNKGT